MTSTKQTEFISFRKASLQNQITEAMALNDDKQLCALKAQWVHRYGLETLLEPEVQDSTLLVREPFASIQDINDIATLENDPIESFGNTSKFDTSVEDCLKPIARCEKDLLGELEIDQTSCEPLSKTQYAQAVITNEAEEIENTLSDSSPVIAPAPPSPEISHLRRWLPSFEDNSIKAS
ncbi:hypothetical protein [Prochlorococcus marinus]|uniref:Uncharacterized protein n=1 Tax=Prochlorococcus marinus (strain MIT 9211) TaxID=93059 RepID=A9BE70_PROM4|nr:hypothetical protein [Prochlorococcus marinus]ABX08380.1 Hypothetical protein P9211_04491 [Prochlorococcus marinus str. MIT 9211]